MLNQHCYSPIFVIQLAEDAFKQSLAAVQIEELYVMQL